MGRVLTEKARADGYGVWGTDLLSEPEGFSGVRYVAADLVDPAAVGSMLDEVNPDFVVHLAAQSSVKRSFDEPAETLSNNTLPVLYLLDYLRERAGSCRLLAVGSADEYGPVESPENLPLREDSPLNPVNPYALAKSIQNQYCRAYASLYGVDAVMTRSFNHTGAGQTDVFVLPNFARQIVEIRQNRRAPVIEVGDLDVKRDFLDVRDVCAAYIGLLRKGKSGETYNVCSGVSFRIRDLLDKMVALAGVDVEIKVDPSRLRKADTPELRGDATRLRDQTGWSPAIPIEETLRSLLDFWEAELTAREKDAG